MSKVLKAISGTVVGLAALGSIIYVDSGGCANDEFALPLTETVWCLGADELKSAKSLLLNAVETQTGYDPELAKALLDHEIGFRKKIAKVLIEQYETQGFVDYDNFVLHNYVLELHFKELEGRGELPIWQTNKAELTNEGKLNRIHDSLKSNLQ